MIMDVTTSSAMRRRFSILHAHLNPSFTNRDKAFQILLSNSSSSESPSMNLSNISINWTSSSVQSSKKDTGRMEESNLDSNSNVKPLKKAVNAGEEPSDIQTLPESLRAISNVKGTKFQNWAHIHECIPERIFFPNSEEEIIRIIQEAKLQRKHIKVSGSGHSPSAIAMCDSNQDWMIQLKNLSGIVSLKQNVVTVKGGTTLNEINHHLESQGMSLSSLGSISEQTISGAISTGTHGTGLQFGNLSSAIERLRIVDGNGNIHIANRGDDLWNASSCSMGAFGVITEVSIRAEPLFKLYAIQKPMPLKLVLENLDQLIRSAEHYRFWWFPHTNNCISWSANRVDTQSRSTSEVQSFLEQFYENVKDKLVGYHLFEFSLYLSRFFPSLVPTINRLYFYTLFSEAKSTVDTSYRIFNFDCRFKQFVNEWAIPIERTKEALLLLKKMIKKYNYKVHLPIEVRFVKKDNIWMSPSYNQDVCYIGIIMYRPYGKSVPFESYFHQFEKIMISLNGRPHWAKEFSLTKEHFQEMYPKFQDFNQIRKKMDPEGIFMNKYLYRILGE